VAQKPFFYAKPSLKNLSNNFTADYLAQPETIAFLIQEQIPLGGKPEGQGGTSGAERERSERATITSSFYDPERV